MTALLMLAFLPQASGQPSIDLAPTVQDVVERQTERAQARAVENAVRQAETVQQRAVQRAEAQAESVQNQAVERAREQVERLQAEAAERAGDQVERVQAQAVERAREQAERQQSRAADQAQGIGQRAAERAHRQAEGLGQGLPGAAERAAQAAQTGPEGSASRTGQEAEPLPERLAVAGQAGGPAFVEVNIEPYVRAVEYEWVMMVSPAQRRQLDEEAPELLQFLVDADGFSVTDSELLTFRVPPDLDADGAILELVPDELEPLIDRNHVYSSQSKEAGKEAALLSLPMAAACEADLSIGMIDSAVEAKHPAFQAMQRRGARLHKRSFVDAGLAQPKGHGTAVAGLLAGEGEALRPLLPGATLYSAAVMYARDDWRPGATVVQLLQGLDWLSGQDLQVINMSLAGPPNKLLARAIEAASAAGKVIVAAAGNEGPHAAPLYPAAYKNVIAVTAVARDHSVYRWAGQGEHIDYAALGVEVSTSLAGGGYGAESGTSIAAPVVSALLACALADSGGRLEQALLRLQGRLLDLGEAGRDPVFGHGLLRPPL